MTVPEDEVEVRVEAGSPVGRVEDGEGDYERQRDDSERELLGHFQTNYSSAVILFYTLEQSSHGGAHTTVKGKDAMIEKLSEGWELVTQLDEGEYLLKK